MSKSRRQRAIHRKLEALRRRAEELTASVNSLPAPSKSSYQLERERAMTEQLKSLFTPEYIQILNQSTQHIMRIDQQMQDLTGRLRHQIQQHRPSGLGSYRTKRLRKKMKS